MGFQKPKRMVQGDSRDLGDIRPSQFTGGMSRQRPLSYATIPQPTATRYYSKPAPKNYRSQRELVQQIVFDHRSKYTSDERRKMNTIRLRKERWRQDRQNQLTSELENIGERTANTLNTAEDARAELLRELKILDLHSEYCWRRSRGDWRVCLKTLWYWVKRRDWRPSVQTQGSDTMTCYCQT
jgi:hypothetical protein